MDRWTVYGSAGCSAPARRRHFSLAGSGTGCYVVATCALRRLWRHRGPRGGPSGPSPRGGSPQKGVNKEYKESFPIFSVKVRVLKLRFLAFYEGPGGFRELREAGRNHFHLSWYLSDNMVTSSGQKSSWGIFLPCTVEQYSCVLLFVIDAFIGIRQAFKRCNLQIVTGP